MKTISAALPAAPAFATILDIRGLQPSSVLCKLSENLAPGDQVNVYGTLDETATGSSANNALIGSVYGNQGDTGSALPVAGWPFLLAQRILGAMPGTFFVSGSAASGSPVAPTSTALPGLTQVAVLSNGAKLPQGTINVVSTAGFASSGSFYLPGLGLGAGIVVTYTGITATSFTGCVNTSGAGATLLSGQAVQGFSAGINLQNFGSGLSIRVGLDQNSTSADVFLVYGTDDPSFVGTAGGELLGQIQGGGQNNGQSIFATNFQLVYVLRIGPVTGGTTGNLLAWGADDTGSGSQGPLDLGSLAVGNTAVSGNIGTPPLTAAQSVDVYSSFVLTQTTGGGINATLPSPTSSAAGKIVFVSLASASASPINMYGAVIFPGTGLSLQWDGAEWTPVGVGDAATVHGNLPGGPMQLGSLDGSGVTLLATGGTVGTGNINVTADTNVNVAATAGAVSITGQTGAGIVATTSSAFVEALAGQAAIIGQDVGIQGSSPASGGGNIVLQPGVLSSVVIAPANGASNTPTFFWSDLAETFFVGFRAPNTLTASTTWILPASDGPAGAPSVLQSDGAGNLSFNQMQSGTSSIGATGASAAIPANITSNSRIVVSVKDFVASTAVGLETKVAGRTIGAPGSFVVTAYDASGALVPAATGTTFDWFVIG